MIKLGAENFIPNGIKKVMLGSDIIFQKEQIIPFTSNPAPTSWSGGSVSAGSKWSGSNEYGSWSVECDVQTTSSHTTNYGYNNDTSSFAETSSNVTSGNRRFWRLTTPEEIAIKPEKITISISNASNSSVIEGWNDSTNDWDNLYTIPQNVSSSYSPTTFNADINTNHYYSIFRITQISVSNNKLRLFNFAITSGTIKYVDNT